MNLKEFGIYFAKLREQSGYRSQRELAFKSGISHSTVNRIESGKHKVTPENLKALAPYLKDVDSDELMRAVGYLSEAEPAIESEPKYYVLSKKDEKDIGKDFDRLLADLESNQALAFNGEPMDEETKRLFAISLENSLRLARELSKQKFTPNKFRN
ncbi:helix-turn-helix domain-containing protein [Paenibacillus sp. LMG 31459]|uniref:Helix-turn-helix domain-containing protein n=1 Tax=Paenibacillus phytohabitans TaxID=2654978 RepID=A0ABX1YPI7_9BACL|nr:helix-turn-helix transcriptional regulator [Paenibacillus phytohabitans]NOU82796.1 helix-turn-helix domain-containing protein [Paenibacillus phytohabitans]